MILDFDKPKKLTDSKTHNQTYQSDSGVAGTYVPNMSDDDNKKFKAKRVGGVDERIEIRVSLSGVQMVVKVFKEENNKPQEYWKRHKIVQMSMNGKLNLSLEDWENVTQAIEEAKSLLRL